MNTTSGTTEKQEEQQRSPAYLIRKRLVHHRICAELNHARDTPIDFAQVAAFFSYNRTIDSTTESIIEDVRRDMASQLGLIYPGNECPTLALQSAVIQQTVQQNETTKHA